MAIIFLASASGAPGVTTAAGALALIWSVSPALAQEAASLRIGATVDGALGDGDARDTDGDYVYDDYRFAARAGQRLEAVLRSEAFDAYLAIYAEGAMGESLAEDDDSQGDGTNARTDNSALTAFSQTKFDNVMQQIWRSGGKPDTVYLSSFQMNVALAFVGNNNARSTIAAEDETVIKHMAVYVTPWGTVEFKPSREHSSRVVFMMQDDMWAVGVLRPPRTEELAKTGDNEKRQVITELTLVCRNEAASGGVFDNSIT
jgi:hypothetical protein